LHTWEYDDLCSGPGPTPYGCGCIAFRPASPPAGAEADAEPAPPTDGLREEIAAHLRYMRERHAAFEDPIPTDDLRDADDLIHSVPGIRRLIAAEEATHAELLAFYGKGDPGKPMDAQSIMRRLRRAAGRRRRALDGDR
jgi:hypothetical protein